MAAHWRSDRSRVCLCWTFRSHLGAVAALPAIAFLAVVHGTVFSGFLAIGFVRCKGCRANRCCQNRIENLRIVFHLICGGVIYGFGMVALESANCLPGLRPQDSINSPRVIPGSRKAALQLGHSRMGGIAVSIRAAVISAIRVVISIVRAAVTPRRVAVSVIVAGRPIIIAIVIIPVSGPV